MKRRNGFTLTEILIALVLVGVLSAVAINTLRSRDMSEEFTAKRDKAIMNIQGVIKNTMFNERIEQLASFDDIKDKVNEHLSARADGDNLFMRDGTMYSINTVSDSSSPYVAELVIDTNGNTLPNSFGLDKYKYKLDLGGNLILDENTDNSNWSGINPPGDIPGGEIPNGGGADPKLPAINNDENKCPSGTHWDGSKCTPDEEVPNNECGPDEQWNGSKCVPKVPEEPETPFIEPEEPIRMCPPGFISVNGECIVEYRSCAGNEIKVNGICQCIDGYERVNGTCQPIECPEGFELVNGTCQPIECSEGFDLVNGTCQPIECDEGYELVNGKCEEVNPCAYLGPTFILKDGICQPYDYCGATAKWDPTTESCVPFNPCKKGYDFVNGSCVLKPCDIEGQVRNKETGVCSCPAEMHVQGNACEWDPCENKDQERVNGKCQWKACPKSGQVRVNGKCQCPDGYIENENSCQIFPFDASYEGKNVNKILNGTFSIRNVNGELIPQISNLLIDVKYLDLQKDAKIQVIAEGTTASGEYFCSSSGLCSFEEEENAYRINTPKYNASFEDDVTVQFYIIIDGNILISNKGMHSVELIYNIEHDALYDVTEIYRGNSDDVPRGDTVYHYGIENANTGDPETSYVLPTLNQVKNMSDNVKNLIIK